MEDIHHSLTLKTDCIIVPEYSSLLHNTKEEDDKRCLRDFAEKGKSVRNESVKVC